jgi:hypothetical protein
MLSLAASAMLKHVSVNEARRRPTKRPRLAGEDESRERWELQDKATYLDGRISVKSARNELAAAGRIIHHREGQYRLMPMGIPSPLIPSPSPSTARAIVWSLRPGNPKECTWPALTWRRSASTGRASRGAMPSGNRIATACWSSSASRTPLCG